MVEIFKKDFAKYVWASGGECKW